MMDNKKIALLATGDEIVNGEILNTNSKTIANTLFSQGMVLGFHMSCDDTQSNIEKAIHFLLEDHDALIITGGLGPTSDDRTRFALAAAINQELQFHEQTWQAIEARFAKYHLKNQPQSNRNQAMFPATAEVIPNENGSAAGCLLSHQGKWIFMLPGPPRECIPMLENKVRPCLEQAGFKTDRVYKKWLLFSVSEGEIAERLDTIAAPFNITTGYRIDYPYTEFKVYADDLAEIEAFSNTVLDILNQYRMNQLDIKASDYLKEQLKKVEHCIKVFDEATNNHFMGTVLNFETQHAIASTTDKSNADYHITGLHEIWQSIDSDLTELQINDKHYQLPNREKRSLIMATERIAQTILDDLLPNN